MVTPAQDELYNGRERVNLMISLTLSGRFFVEKGKLTIEEELPAESHRQFST
jgi:hypothetical protein